MKVLYISRLFSGLEQSIIDQNWKPTGVPTIYRLLEKLEIECDELKIIFSIKEGFLKKKYYKSFSLKLEPFSNQIKILSASKFLSYLPKSIKFILTEISHTLYYFFYIIKFRPDIIYFDHGNIWSGGIISRIFSVPTVFRVMGVYPIMRTVLIKKSIKSKILKWLYRSPFNQVICTQDGSGIEPWLDKAIKPGIKIHKLINGVPKNFLNNDEIKKLENEIVITFIGKIEFSKGAEEFVVSAINSIKKCSLKLKFYVIGSGSLRHKLIDYVRGKGFTSSFEFIEKVENKEILKFLIKTDIYISLNRYGNLSNSNLEAIAAKKCMIIPISQSKFGIDLITDKLLSDNSVLRVKSSNDIQGISDGITFLAENYKVRQKMINHIKKFSLKLDSWDTRIKKEINILKTILEK